MTAPRSLMPLVASFVEAGSEPYFVLLPETDLGYMYRGDTLILPIWEARNQSGTLIDLTGATVWFTAKTDINLPDEGLNVIQCSTMIGGLEILDADDGMYRVTVPPSATQSLTDDTVYVFDAQVRTSPPAPATPATHTIKRGFFVVVRDVTRATA